MVVPLKLTQFYGHSVPRPRIYVDMKFGNRRVDPPPSVNDALLSWASDAPWSMGGLSFKTLRSQGTVEGSVRRLRAFLEEEEEGPDTSEKAKAPSREAASKPEENSVTVKPSAAKVAGRPIEKKRQRSDEESVKATPARKLTRREAAEESTDEGSPAFVPSTQEKVKKVADSAPSVRKKLPAKAEAVEEETPSSVAATRERRREKLFSPSGKTPCASKSPANNGNLSPESSPASDGGRSTRSGIKKAVASVQLSQSSEGRPRARTILTRGSLASDEDSSESDDGLEAFLKEKRCTPRRSSRLVKEQGTSLHRSLSGSDSDSE